MLQRQGDQEDNDEGYSAINIACSDGFMEGFFERVLPVLISSRKGFRLSRSHGSTLAFTVDCRSMKSTGWSTRYPQTWRR